ncbi:MAG: hypothetical protein KME31_33300 [Tolypothrix carrinoi HA7290-LM1]|nr:hypothetical protein [Tolypothrix carrinoi HA7290-LM1]
MNPQDACSPQAVVDLNTHRHRLSAKSPKVGRKLWSAIANTKAPITRIITPYGSNS